MKEYRDYYFNKAKRENYPARSVYKLKELDKKYRLLKKGIKVLDLGAAPGSWTQGALEKIGESGALVACDLKPLGIRLAANAKFYQEDIFKPSEDFLRVLREDGPFDLIMSDMAPATTGSKFTDQARSLDLCKRAFEFAREYLKSDGNFAVKIFMGPDVGELLESMREVFEDVKTFKPKSSRAESKETFFVGLRFKAPDHESLPKGQARV
ncbi:MAG: RlmE family RNA methyltransferase [Desulfovibrio sp.]|nr:RlmE family RNA methyltransferase [Desulfovibrio sp.]